MIVSGTSCSRFFVVFEDRTGWYVLCLESKWYSRCTPSVTSGKCAVSYHNAKVKRPEIAALVSEMAADPLGDFSPSVYETARLVRHAPSLRGHSRRVRYLLDEQRDTGGWGGPDEYGLVPTLSATAALLAFARDLPAAGVAGIGRAEVVRAADRGLRALAAWPAGAPARLPDTVAVEILVPGLVAEVDEQLDPDPPAGLDVWRGRRLARAPGPHEQLLDALRGALRAGHALPAKLAHTLEVFGDAALRARFTEPKAGGIGCSPAATAAWLGDDTVRAGRHPSVRYLERVQARCGGPVPVAAPLPVFERAWVLSTVAGAGLLPRSAGVGEMVRGLHAEFGEAGVAGGAGLPPDADDTATALTALARLGSPRPADCLWDYREPDGHFSCFTDERTPSTSTNAHVLQALGACRPLESTRYRRAMARVAEWLCERQEPDGGWTDKWHASPYYATACCVLALADHGGERAAGALRAAVEWVLGTRRADGSWGRWAGTFEETAYAVQVLCRSRRFGVPNAAVDRAVAAGYARLGRADGEPHPPLWHDKDLYTPVRIVRAEGLVARHLAATVTGARSSSVPRGGSRR
jgi:squalene-hopene cyclase-like protein/prenyltransferase/squalene oxidase-like repeat protein